MARKKYKITKASEGLFKQVLADIYAHGKSKKCPVVLKNILLSDCDICHKAFPKSKGENVNYYLCPCRKQYNKQYLIKRVKQIIKTGEL